MSEVRNALTHELKGKTLIIDFFKKKFDRLKLTGKDIY